MASAKKLELDRLDGEIAETKAQLALLEARAERLRAELAKPDVPQPPDVGEMRS